MPANSSNQLQNTEQSGMPYRKEMQNFNKKKVQQSSWSDLQASEGKLDLLDNQGCFWWITFGSNWFSLFKLYSGAGAT